MKKNILLAIDIGNTNIVMGMFKSSRLIRKKIIPTKNVYTSTQCRRELKKIQGKDAFEALIISSVVPRALRSIKRCAGKTFDCPVFVLGENIFAPIKNRYKKPKQVGQDRLANGVAMYNKYKGGIVVDFGTAVTFDLITKKNEYLGGVIFPGIRLSLENLSLKAALLPKIKLKRPKSILGKDTTASMRSGVVNGYGVLCEGLLEKLKSKYGKSLQVVATGGDAPLLARNCPSIDKVDQDLTLKGLLITYLSL